MARARNNHDINVRKLARGRPNFVEPTLAKLVDHLPRGDAWRYELKPDGYRSLVMKRKNEGPVFSRRGNIFNSEFPEIASGFGFVPSRLTCTTMRTNR